MQWMKKFWDANYPGGSYDAIKRRGSSGTQSQPAQTARAPAGLTRASPQRTNSVSSRSHAGPAPTLSQDKTVADLKKALLEMEKERDFYFNKLRDIEIMTQKATEKEVVDSSFFRQITHVLYATEDGFEIPDSSITAIKTN
jgi:RP/EB family microtubule-associated protein